MKERLARWMANRNALYKKYGGLLLVVALGALLMMLPSGEKRETTAGEEKEDTFDLAAFEEKMADCLSGVKGAGRVEVVLSVDSGSRRILAQDVRQEGEQITRDVVTLGRGSGSQTVVPLQTVAPEFRGALVVCDGGNDPQVRLSLLQAVTALTGLGADRVCICQRDG